jgi:hypothetical protein
MPLRDRFHTNSTILNWEGLHVFWPSTIVARLNRTLPVWLSENFLIPLELDATCEND